MGHAIRSFAAGKDVCALRSTQLKENSTSFIQLLTEKFCLQKKISVHFLYFQASSRLFSRVSFNLLTYEWLAEELTGLTFAAIAILSPGLSDSFSRLDTGHTTYSRRELRSPLPPAWLSSSPAARAHRSPSAYRSSGSPPHSWTISSCHGNPRNFCAESPDPVETTLRVNHGTD